MTFKTDKMLKQLRASATNDTRFLLPERIMARWKPEMQAADDTSDATINIYDIVGEDWWTGEGMTAKLVSSILRKNKGKEITVNINSPGGNIAEGIAIYNLLREHDADITVRIIGVAASIASVVAMAGNTIKVAESAFVMIHNGWNCVCGNKNDMREMADTLEQLDQAMIGIYNKQANISESEIADMMDNETWISGTDAVEMGFATQFLDSDEVEKPESSEAKYNSSLKEVDIALAKGGKSRSERRAILKDLTSTPGATVKEEATPSAGTELCEALTAFNETLKHIRG